jgi:hypothetical protein
VVNVGGLDPGTFYVVQFYIAQRPGFGVNPVSVTVDGPNTPIGSFTPGSTGFVPVTSTAFGASRPNATLIFTGTSPGGDSGTAIDMITVVPVARVPQ